jgi:hypothetical protein
LTLSISPTHTHQQQQKKKKKKQGVTWSTPWVFAATAASVESCGLELAPREALRELADIDTLDDLVAWRRRRSRVEQQTVERLLPSGSSSYGSESLVSVVDEVLSSI